MQNPQWSHDCALHDNWMAQNHALSHQETPGSPGYTEEGNWAGQHSVLAVGQPAFTKPSRNPFLNAPYHLGQILYPSLDVMGAAEAHGYDCETTFPGYKRAHPAKDRLYSFPGEGKSIAWAQNAAEGPAVPGDAVGLPQGTTTGPNLIVFWDGPQSPAPLTDVRRATLTRKDGAKVDVRVVDDRNGYAWPGSGFVIPVRPLKPGREYTGKVTFGSRYASRTFTHSWTFRTDKLRTGRKAVSIGVHKHGNDLAVSALAHDRAYVGHDAKLFADYGSFKFDKPIGMKIGETTAYIPGPAHGKSVRLTLKVLSFKVGGTRTKGFKVKRTVKG